MNTSGNAGKIAASRRKRRKIAAKRPAGPRKASAAPSQSPRDMGVPLPAKGQDLTDLGAGTGRDDVPGDIYRRVPPPCAVLYKRPVLRRQPVEALECAHVHRRCRGHVLEEESDLDLGGVGETV